jgi:DNA-binding response OmpR family regulator
VEAGLQSLLLCTDDKVVRVLRRVLSEMEIGVELCADADAAVQKLTRQRFEAVIIDCTSHASASAVLKGTRSAPANRRAISVAILDGQGPVEGEAALKQTFSLGAHFVLFKPIALERTRASFRAVRALMKRERRRHARIPIEISVLVGDEASNSSWYGTTADLGENGMALKIKDRKVSASFPLRFTLPGTSNEISCTGEVAWQGNHLAGIRFSAISTECSDQMKQWIEGQLLGPEADEVTVSCKLTDLSLNACYLQTESPFPVRTRLRLMMKVGEHGLQIEGIVRVMHPFGMGIEFTQHTPTQKTKVEEFIQTLVNNEGAIPDLQVRPDSIDNSAYSQWEIPGDSPDPLLSLFRTKADYAAEAFQMELKKQRGVQTEVEVGA